MKQQLFSLTVIFFTTVCFMQLAKAQGGNTKYGESALYFNTSGGYNTAIGENCLAFNSSGSYNTATGYSALYQNNTGSYNTATGYTALYLNTTGGFNTAHGYQALLLNRTGSSNTAIGSSALFFNTSGEQNTATGYSALYSNNTGIFNTAAGSYALYKNNSGNYNTAAGSYALNSNATGSYNTANGYSALYYNTSTYNTAYGAMALYYNNRGSFNTAVGFEALFSNTAGNYNTAAGRRPLFRNTTGFNNTAVGNYSLYDNTTGSRNTALGDSAGATFNSTYSTFIGYKTAVTATNLTNVTLIGNQAYATASNQVRIGNGSVTSIGGKVGWSTLSDGRFKKNVKADVPGLKFIIKLKPVTYTLDIEAIDHASGVSEQPSGDQISTRAAASKERHTGFVAQEVEEAAKQLNYDFGGVDKPKNDKDFYGLRYAEFVVPLVKAVQELSKENEELRQRLDKLEALIKAGNVNGNPNISTNISSAYLQPNAPNPFSSSTLIRYSIPFNTKSAKVVISDMNGALIKNITVNSSINGQVVLNKGSLSAGTYNYSLWVDGRQVDTKQLIVAK